jgi:hypothetical protein
MIIVATDNDISGLNVTYLLSVNKIMNAYIFVLTESNSEVEA